MIETIWDWDHALALSYDEAIERAVDEFANGRTDVTTWRGDDIEVSFTADLFGAKSYDEASPPSIVLEFDAGALVLSRETFESAAWLEQDAPIAPIRALRFTMGDREIELTHP